MKNVLCVINPKDVYVRVATSVPGDTVSPDTLFP